MPRDVRQRVEVSDEEDEEVRRDVMTDGDEEAAEPKNEEVEEVKDVNKEGDDENGDDEEVYEIESIIHHKKKMFGKSTGFFVKWKGYPASENSWVMEEDCNAPELISDYYASLNKKANSKPRSKRPKDEDTEMEELTKPKKLKRKSSDRASNKESHSNGRTSLRAVNKDADTDAEMDVSPGLLAQSQYGNMGAYFDRESWADLIDKIITVDYTDDGSHSVVYFLRLKNGEQCATTGEWMAKKAPALTIRFFENNLRFRAESE